MKAVYIFILCLVAACQSQGEGSQSDFNSFYEVYSYYGNPDDPKNLRSVRYFDSSNKLLRELGGDVGCTRYIYDETGKLIETVWGRSCEQRHGVRNIFIYDSLNNHIGNFTTYDTLISLDTIQFQQTFFYDSANRLVKEKTGERVESPFDTIATWKYYFYSGSKIDSVKLLENDGLLWNIAYRYDKKGRLEGLRKTRGNTYENEYYIYDGFGKLIEKGTNSNEKVTSPMGSFDMPETKRVYTYDSSGFQTKEILYHDGKAVVEVNNIKKFKNNAP
jgi:hypothetical protein